MKQARHSWLIAGIGAALLAAGLVLLKLDSHPQGVMLALPYVCIGLGCGAFGCGLGDLIQGRAVRKHPQLQKQMEIEQKDELQHCQFPTGQRRRPMTSCSTYSAR